MQGALEFSVLPKTLWTGGVWDETTDPAISEQPTLPPEPQLYWAELWSLFVSLSIHVGRLSIPTSQKKVWDSPRLMEEEEEEEVWIAGG